MSTLSNQNRITILISDSSEIYQTGLARTIRGVTEGSNIVYARNHDEISSILQHTPVDLVILEVTLASGELIRQLRSKYRLMKMIGYGSISNCSIIKTFAKLGLNGYLLKNDPRTEFTQAIKCVLKDQLYFCEKVQLLLNNKLIGEDQILEDERLDAITKERFREILYLIYHEKTIKEIASDLNLSIKTVEGHRTRLLRLIGANNMVGLALFAERQQLHFDNELKRKFKIKGRLYIDS